LTYTLFTFPENQLFAFVKTLLYDIGSYLM
ncbi:hypothetical protein MNBD_GAMMA01-926, partial [hydrothermal vent metagenome]